MNDEKKIEAAADIQAKHRWRYPCDADYHREYKLGFEAGVAWRDLNPSPEVMSFLKTISEKSINESLTGVAALVKALEEIEAPAPDNEVPGREDNIDEECDKLLKLNTKRRNIARKALADWRGK